jgi:hypothetical protein
MRRTTIKTSKPEVVIFKTIPDEYKGLRVEDRCPSNSELSSWIKWRNKEQKKFSEPWIMVDVRKALIKTNISGRGNGSNPWWCVGAQVTLKGGASLLFWKALDKVKLLDKGFHPYILIAIKG